VSWSRRSRKPQGPVITVLWLCMALLMAGAALVAGWYVLAVLWILFLVVQVALARGRSPWSKNGADE
jgi:hypothetical protein